jgi:hypothetical protein
VNPFFQSIALPMFVKDDAFDHQRLYDVAFMVTKNLNKVIDVNYYPVKEARTSNMKHRPIGLGVQVRSSSSLLSIITCLAFAIKHSPHRVTSISTGPPVKPGVFHRTSDYGDNSGAYLAIATKHSLSIHLLFTSTGPRRHVHGAASGVGDARGAAAEQRDFRDAL